MLAASFLACVLALPAYGAKKKWWARGSVAFVCGFDFGGGHMFTGSGAWEPSVSWWLGDLRLSLLGSVFRTQESGIVGIVELSGSQSIRLSRKGFAIFAGGGIQYWGNQLHPYVINAGLVIPIKVKFFRGIQEISLKYTYLGLDYQASLVSAGLGIQF